MFYHENKLQYEVEVEEPDPEFAQMLQQAIGGVEGEMRVANQYMFQAWSLPDEYEEYREVLLDTAAEEIGHIEMLAVAVAKNLEGAPVETRNEVQRGMMPRQLLSSGLHALAVDSNGVPFNGNYVVGSGNIAADLVANVMAESTGRLLATRLFEATDDPGMKDMLSYLIARDTMHQNQWLTLLKDLGDSEDVFDVFPIPDSFPDAEENQKFNYAYLSTDAEPEPDPHAPWTTGPSIDGEGEYSYVQQQSQDGGPISAPTPPPQTYDAPEEKHED